jgi:hypothetical protein
VNNITELNLSVGHPLHISAEQAIQEGRDMAEKEGEGAFESIEIRHCAEVKAAGIQANHIQAKGSVALQLRDTLHAKLQQLGFNLANHLHEMARGRIDMMQAVGLLVVSIALALFVLLAFGPAWLALALAFVIVGSAAAVEEFFHALEERDAVREGISLTVSIIGLIAQFMIGNVRGALISVMPTTDAGPVSHTLVHGGTLVQHALAMLTFVIEVMAGWKFFRARAALLSPTARAFCERERLNAQLCHLSSALEAAKSGPEIRRHYRAVGIRQFLAWSAGEDTRARSAHLQRALKFAAVALAILALLFLVVTRAAAATSAERDVVAVVDLSKSTPLADFRANIESVSQLLSKLQVRDRAIILGITEGFGRSMLLDQTMPADEGYRGLQAQAAREGIIAQWQAIAKDLKPVSLRTDILGALATIQYLGHFSTDSAQIFLFGDLQQSTVDLDLEHLEVIPVERSILALKRRSAIRSLKGANVFALGVSPNGKSATYYDTLHAFWSTFFHESGADLRVFSIARAIPEF